MKPLASLDIELFRNYLLIMFKRADTGAVRYFEMTPTTSLDRAGVADTLRRCTTVGFNSNKFDMPLIAYALAGASCEQMKAAADLIIYGGLQPWQFLDRVNCQLPDADHIDLIEVAPGMVSLKIYGGRMHCPKMQDLPLHHDALVDASDRVRIRTYCENDLDITLMLYRKFKAQIDLRAEMSSNLGIDVRSKSDAQIA